MTGLSIPSEAPHSAFGKPAVKAVVHITASQGGSVVTEAWERTLEQALSRTEGDAIAALQAAAAVTSALRRVRRAAKTGDTKALVTSLDLVDGSQTRLSEQIANSKEGWDFEVERSMEDGSYTRDLLETARKIGLRIYESEGSLFSYPSVVRVSPKDCAVYVDKKRDQQIRPSVLVARLKRQQQNPPAFRAQAFLEALHKAYRRLVASRSGGESTSPDIRLLDIYDLLTLLPGQSSEYSKQDFVRDVYRLHASGFATTKDGSTVEFHASTATKKVSNRLTIVTETGEIRFYATVRFTKA